MLKMLSGLWARAFGRRKVRVAVREIMDCGKALSEENTMLRRQMKADAAQHKVEIELLRDKCDSLEADRDFLLSPAADEPLRAQNVVLQGRVAMLEAELRSAYACSLSDFQQAQARGLPFGVSQGFNEWAARQAAAMQAQQPPPFGVAPGLQGFPGSTRFPAVSQYLGQCDASAQMNMNQLKATMGLGPA